MLATLQIIWSSLKMAIIELRVNKIRTFLSLLGITIGIFCIISVLTVTDSMERSIRNDLESLGTDVIYLQRYPWGNSNLSWQEIMRRPKFTYREMGQLRTRMHSAEEVVFIYDQSGKRIEFGSSYVTGSEMIAVSDGFDRLQPIELEAGRYFSTPEINNGAQVALLGSEMWEPLFGTASMAIDKEIKFSDRKFLVIGALKKKGSSLIGGVLNDSKIVMPYFTAQKIVDESRWSEPFLLVKAKSDVPVLQLKDELNGTLRAIRKLKPSDNNNFELNEITSAQESMQELFLYINLSGTLIAIFALFVGSFGIANIMFVTVKERTNIIGLKKAIGAKPSVILIEFLIEAVLLCLLGGIMGLLIVYLGTLAFANFIEAFQISLSLKNILIGLSVSAIVGTLAGIIPAWSASKLDPVVAIRSN
jgi:putative ABC transport system permease protein